MRANPADARAPYYLGNLCTTGDVTPRPLPLGAQREARSALFGGLAKSGHRLLQLGSSPARRERPTNVHSATNPPTPGCCLNGISFGNDWANRLQDGCENSKNVLIWCDNATISAWNCRPSTIKLAEHEKALTLISGRTFQPWEGGEGQAIAQYVAAGSPSDAEPWPKAMPPPLSNTSRPRRLRRVISARPSICWPTKATSTTGSDGAGRDGHELRHEALAGRREVQGGFSGDERPGIFRDDLLLGPRLDATRPNGEGEETPGRSARLRERLRKSEAKIDYFATSLPTMLLFDDDIRFRQETTALFLQAQARLGLGQRSKALSLLQTVLQRDPNHALAADLLNENGS